jgi:hypothetical protein
MAIRACRYLRSRDGRCWVRVSQKELSPHSSTAVMMLLIPTKYSVLINNVDDHPSIITTFARYVRSVFTKLQDELETAANSTWPLVCSVIKAKCEPGLT